MRTEGRGEYTVKLMTPKFGESHFPGLRTWGHIHHIFFSFRGYIQNCVGFGGSTKPGSAPGQTRIKGMVHEHIEYE